MPCQAVGMGPAMAASGTRGELSTGHSSTVMQEPWLTDMQITPAAQILLASSWQQDHCQVTCIFHIRLSPPSQCTLAQQAPPAQPACAVANNTCHCASRLLTVNSKATSNFSHSKTAGVRALAFPHVMLVRHQYIRHLLISERRSFTSSSTGPLLATAGCQFCARSVTEQHSLHKRIGAAACTEHTNSSMCSDSRHLHRRHHHRQQLMTWAFLAKER